MVFAKSFFELQLRFASAVQALSGLPRERVLFEYTNLYVRFGLGRVFDADHPKWQAYLEGLRNADDELEWTYRFYLMDAEATTAPSVAATFGCFSYAVPSGTKIRLHYLNTDPGHQAALGSARIAQRRAELAALFDHGKRTVGSDTPVIGVSWLYNLKAYRRLFPAAYTSSPRPIQNKFRSMTLWGQFLNRRGELKETMTRPFLRSLNQQSSLARLDKCFPFSVLTVRAPLRIF